MGRVLLLGDLIEDVYYFGAVERICPEAPVPVFLPEREEKRAGGFGLVADNLQALGVKGKAWYGSFSRKTRYMVGRHLLIRVDEDSIQGAYLTPAPLDELEAYDAIIVSDYDKGAITDEIARLIIKRGRKVFVDTKRFNPSIYAGAYAIFPNANEADDVDPSLYSHVIRKDGPRGCYVDDVHIPTTPREEYDVTGAGDVFLAAFVAAHLRGRDLVECAKVANKAAGISVGHIGGHVLSASEVDELWTL